MPGADGSPSGQTDRRERERLARREEILEAARRVFAARGFHAATLDEIAAEAHFSKGALYGYFENKEDLYATILEGEFDRITAAIRQAMGEHQDPVDVLKEAIRLKFQLHAGRKEFFAEIGKGQARLTSPRGSGDEMGWHVMSRFRARFFGAVDLLAEVVDGGVRMGKLRSDIPAKQMAISLLGLVHSSFFYWLVNGASEPVDAISERVARMFLDGARSRTEGHQ